MKKTKLLLIGMVLFCAKMNAQSQPFLGQIMFVPYNFAPDGWRDCDGSTLSISENDALFALLGTTYGGDGMSNFKLPDMRGRVVIDDGGGSGLSTYVIGQMGGQEAVSLTINQMPAHNHSVLASSSDGNTNLPTNAFPANTKTLDKEYSSVAPNTTFKPNALSISGGSAPHSNMMPTTALKCVIAIYGIFPSQN